jgi:hypothetical protein
MSSKVCQKCYLKPRYRVRNWFAVSHEEIYVTLGLIEIIQEPTYKSYCHMFMAV